MMLAPAPPKIEVVAVSARDDVALRRPVIEIHRPGSGVWRTVNDVVASVAEKEIADAPGGRDEVVAIAAMDGTAAGVAGHQHVVAGTAVNEIAPGSPIDDVIAGPAENRIVAVAAVDETVACTTDDRVVAALAVEDIVPIAADNAVVSGAAEYRVVPRACDKRVVTGLTVDQIVA